MENMMFKTLIEELGKGKTFEEICSNCGNNNVECVKNEVYEDDDLNEFLQQLGAEIFDYGVGYAVIMTNDGESYELPYEERKIVLMTIFQMKQFYILILTKFTM